MRHITQLRGFAALVDIVVIGDAVDTGDLALFSGGFICNIRAGSAPRDDRYVPPLDVAESSSSFVDSSLHIRVKIGTLMLTGG